MPPINAAPTPLRAVCEQDGRGAHSPVCLLLAGITAGFAPAGLGRLGRFFGGEKSGLHAVQIAPMQQEQQDPAAVALPSPADVRAYRMERNTCQ